MEQDIPHIKFEPAKKDNIGFEIIPLQRIDRDRDKYDHDPEQPHQRYHEILYLLVAHHVAPQLASP